MRQMVIGALAALADAEYQRTVWIDRVFPHPGYYNDLSMSIHALYDDCSVLPDPLASVGTVLLNGPEIHRMMKLDAVFGPIIDELRNAEDRLYLQHPGWPSVVVAAGHALSAMILAGAYTDAW